jgi:hypothetical protein
MHTYISIYTHEWNIHTHTHTHTHTHIHVHTRTTYVAKRCFAGSSRTSVARRRGAPRCCVGERRHAVPPENSCNRRSSERDTPQHECASQGSESVVALEFALLRPWWWGALRGLWEEEEEDVVALAIAEADDGEWSDGGDIASPQERCKGRKSGLALTSCVYVCV